MLKVKRLGMLNWTPQLQTYHNSCLVLQ